MLNYGAHAIGRSMWAFGANAFVFLALVTEGVSTVGAALQNAAPDPDIQAAHKAQSEGRDADAERIYFAAVKQAEQQGESPRLARLLDELGMLYCREGRYSEAEKSLDRAVAMDSRLYGPDDPRLGHDLLDLAVLYTAQQRHQDEEKAYKRALDIASQSPHSNPILSKSRSTTWQSFTGSRKGIRGRGRCWNA